MEGTVLRHMEEKCIKKYFCAEITTPEAVQNFDFWISSLQLVYMGSKKAAELRIRKGREQSTGSSAAVHPLLFAYRYQASDVLSGWMPL